MILKSMWILNLFMKIIDSKSTCKARHSIPTQLNKIHWTKSIIQKTIKKYFINKHWTEIILKIHPEN